MFKNTSQKQINIALTVLRVIVGVIFIAHGAQKIFVFGFAGVAGGFAHMGVPAPQIMGPFVALVEFLGGIALVVGLLTRLASLGLAVDMLVAMLLVHMKNGFFMPNGYEFVLALFAAATALTFTGAGQWSVDALIGRKANDTNTDITEARNRRAA